MLQIISKLQILYLKPQFLRLGTLGVLGYAPHKSASMFIYKLFRDLAHLRGMSFFSDNNPLPNLQTFHSDIGHSFCIAPIRSLMPIADIFSNIEKVKVIIQIRDPRDIIVSEYYSFAFSHPDNNWSEEKKKSREIIKRMSIDDYVLSTLYNEDAHHFRLSKYSLKERFLEHLPLLADGALIVKYEDMIVNYKDWLQPIVESFEFGHHNSVVQQYFYLRYKEKFLIPKKENINTHKRSLKSK